MWKNSTFGGGGSGGGGGGVGGYGDGGDDDGVDEGDDLILFFLPDFFSGYLL